MTFDRTAEDLGNAVNLGHVNVRIPDQRLATLFYIDGLGLTRDPYMMTGVDNMWANAGVSQMHLPTGEPQVVRGKIGLILPDRDALLIRLAAVRRSLDGTRFRFSEDDDAVDVVCPWGNHFRCHAPNQKRFGPTVLGFAYVEFDVPPGVVDGIAAFYNAILEVPAHVSLKDGAVAAVAQVGHKQELIFRECTSPQIPYDRHHIQIYLTNFSRPYNRLLERSLITAENGQHQYRFERIVDPGDGRVLFNLDHELRSMTHPMFARPLVNRNPAQNVRTYVSGHDEAPWA